MKERSDSIEFILAKQKSWSRGRDRDGRWSNYLANLEDNLFLRRLHPETEAEFREGDGAELSDARTRPAKMRALVSSSALAVNFFDAWRVADKRQMAAALQRKRGQPLT